MKPPLILVSAFNEAESLGKVLADLKNHGFNNIVLVDDGSLDQTSQIAAKAKVPVLRHVVNRGLGAAIGTGFEFARSTGAEILVTFDADCQHQARDILRLIKPIKDGTADVVIGSRLLGRSSQMPKIRKLFNHLSNIATLTLYWVWSTDTLSGLRAFNKKAIDRIRLKSDRMEFSNEIFKHIRFYGLRYKEIPIDAIYTEYSNRSSSQGSYLTAPIKLTFRMVLRLFS